MPNIPLTPYEITRTDGGVSILYLCQGADLQKAIAKWDESQKLLGEPSYISHRPISVADIPADRTFRAAWKPGLTVDIAKARNLHKGRMRAARKPRLEVLDAEMMRALEDGNQAAVADIKRRKKALRDVTDDPAIAAAATPEALKAVWPDALK